MSQRKARAYRKAGKIVLSIGIPVLAVGLILSLFAIIHFVGATQSFVDLAMHSGNYDRIQAAGIQSAYIAASATLGLALSVFFTGVAGAIVGPILLSRAKKNEVRAEEAYIEQ